jgi:hypothetical protein
VASPYFNKNQELVLFYDYLKKNAPAFLPKKIDRHHVYRSLFPSKQYDDKHFKYLMSFLLKLAEQFIGLQQYEKQGLQSEFHLLNACIDRKLEKNYKNIYQKTVDQLEQTPFRDGSYFYQQYQLAELAGTYFANQGIRKVSEELQKAVDYFDLYYLSQKLKYTCDMLNAQKMLSADYQQNLIDEISHYLQGKNPEKIPAVGVYYLVFLILTEKEPAHNFEKLTKMLQLHSGLFPPHERKQLQIHAINFCIRKIRQNEEPYVGEALRLYMEGIEAGYLLDDGVLSPFTFKNVIKLGLRLKRYDWTDQFITAHADRLDPKFQKNALSYGLADLNYHKGDHETSMIHLREVEFTDIFFTLSAKVMLLKLYYENDEVEALHSLLNSFRMFLSRNKLISNEVRKTYQHFTKLLNQVVITDKKAKLQAIKDRIQQTEPLTERGWLLNAVMKKLG